MSIRGRCLAFATLCFLLSASFAAGCKRDEPVEEKKQPPASVEADVSATPAATQATAQGDPYDDSLVLLAEGEPDSGTAPLVVQFEVESLVVDELSAPQYTWDFGDGSPKSNEANPKHTYEKSGEYTATIGVVDASGEHGWDEVDISVEAPSSEADHQNPE
jgi:PKD domain